LPHPARPVPGWRLSQTIPLLHPTLFAVPSPPDLHLCVRVSSTLVSCTFERLPLSPSMVDVTQVFLLSPCSQRALDVFFYERALELGIDGLPRFSHLRLSIRQNTYRFRAVREAWVPPHIFLKESFSSLPLPFRCAFNAAPAIVADSPAAGGWQQSSRKSVMAFPRSLVCQGHILSFLLTLRIGGGSPVLRSCFWVPSLTTPPLLDRHCELLSSE